MYFSAFTVRVTHDDVQGLRLAKALHAVNVAQAYLRISKAYAVLPRIGPKLIILSRMMSRDLFVFLCFFIVILLAYSVAAEAILSPESELGAQTFANVFYRPFFQLFGELQLGN